MNSKSEITMDRKAIIGDTISWLVGIIFFAIGCINIFWGNDRWFGVFIALLSLSFFPPVNVMFKKITGFAIPIVIKFIVGIFILWAALGVGELFDKIDLMIMDLK